MTEWKKIKLYLETSKAFNFFSYILASWSFIKT